MNLKVNLLFVIMIAITVYMMFIAMKLCKTTEPFVTDSETNPDILKSQDIDLAKYYQKLSQTAVLNVDPNMADPIGDANIPYSQNIYDKPMVDKSIYEYEVISVYKKILGRNPNSEELQKGVRQFRDGELNEDLLRTYLLNSTEYSLNVKLQSNEVNDDIEYRYAKQDLVGMIAKMYFDELHTDAPKRILLPLRDIFMFLDSDKYIFRAMLIHVNYKKFEEEIMTSNLMKKENLLQTFEKHFDMNDLKFKANDIKRYDTLHNVNTEGTQQPSALPASTQGADLQIVNSGNLGAGSGARQPKTLEELMKSMS